MSNIGQSMRSTGAVALVGFVCLLSTRASAGGIGVGSQLQAQQNARLLAAVLLLKAPRWDFSIFERLFPSVGFAEVNDVDAGQVKLGVGTSLRIMYRPFDWGRVGLGFGKIGWSTHYEGSGSVSNNDGDTLEASLVLRFDPFSSPSEPLGFYALAQASVALTGSVEGSGLRVVALGEGPEVQSVVPPIAEGELRSGYSFGGSLGTRYSLFENVGLFAEIGLDWRNAHFAPNSPSGDVDAATAEELERGTRGVFSAIRTPESRFRLIQLAIDIGVNIQF